MNTVLFSVSIVLQFSGAVLLIINNFSSTKRKIAMEYFPKQGKSVVTNNRLMIEDKDSLKDILSDIYMNRISFIYIAIGYITAVLGENECLNKYVLTIVLILISTCLVLGTRYLVCRCAEYRAAKSEYLFLDTEDVDEKSIISEEY